MLSKRISALSSPPSGAPRRASRATLETARRAAAIVGTFTRETARLDRPFPLRLRRSCEQLGATFIKAAQVIASTYGVVPERFVAEFQSCLDSVPPLPPDEARRAAEA